MKPTPRAFEMVPVSTPDGRLFRLSPGKYNAVQTAIIEQFAPRFVPGAVVLYLDDTNSKMSASAQPVMTELCIPQNWHNKLPSVVLWDQKRSWLFVIEAMTSHGPMSPQRLHELNTILKKCSAELLFISVFSDMDEFTDHLDEIAWQTHVWIADTPDHLIHFNGDKFLGPYKDGR